ncbi:hypothetical protein [Micromonospora sp. CB01531]|uniref:hypothetical protein n=1 Tax=Micromonospora sp. CB01531 TaxID=1718947 RepID=UPI000938B33A|nr:hypothetical protein [Micromonospora sp. CB01531]OKI54551.1 hypothetical protein A6A27_32000 [Micromonospora sp. CB01531]
MGTWGSDPDVALFVGGPKDGLIESIKGNRSQRYVIRQDFQVWSFTDPGPIGRANYRYGHYEPAKTWCDGKVYTVMADKQRITLQEISDRVVREVAQQHWTLGITTAQQQRAAWGLTVDDLKKFMDDLFPPPDTRNDEEKLSWLTEKTPGKREFL